MTDARDIPFGDPVTAPFWAGARDRRLLVQCCNACGARQFYPRGFCLNCQSLDLGWIESAGQGEIHSMVTVRVQITPEIPPPYVLALVDLDEGVRMLSNIEGGPCAIGDRVRVAWRDRGKDPPLPIFEPLQA